MTKYGPLYLKVRQVFLEHKWVKPRERILVAVSGGADSVFLMNVLKQLSESMEFELVVAHIQHGLRGKESEEEEQFVAALAKEWGLPFYCKEVKVKEGILSSGKSLQVVARDLRYQALAELSQELGIYLVATAHHADDQAETLIQRFLRGSSLDGLGGIHLERSWPYVLPERYPLRLIRPLLPFSKQEILQSMKSEGILYRNDSSNASTKYFRNKIRLHLLPILKEDYNAGIVETLGQTAILLQDENQYLNEQASIAFKEVVEKEEHHFKLDKTRFCKFPVALQRRVIKLILYYLVPDFPEWKFTHIENVRELIQEDNPHAKYHLPLGIRVKRIYNSIHIGFMKTELSGEEERIVPGSYRIEIPGITYIDSLHLKVHTEVLDASGIDDSLRGKDATSSQIWFDYDCLNSSSLYIRVKRPGDRIKLLGMSGNKKIKGLLNEAKIPLDSRENWPVLVKGDTILWAIGLRRSDACLVNHKTKRILRINVFSLNQI